MIQRTATHSEPNSMAASPMSIPTDHTAVGSDSRNRIAETSRKTSAAATPSPNMSRSRSVIRWRRVT